jgi:hypothetical protein
VKQGFEEYKTLGNSGTEGRGWMSAVFNSGNPGDPGNFGNDISVDQW